MTKKPKAKPAREPKAAAKPGTKPPAKRKPPRAAITVTGMPQRIWPREVIIGKRHRKDMGDLPELARSIDERNGLLQPIVLTPGYELIGGQRRLAAWALSKFRAEPIPYHVVDVDAIVAGEWDENTKRKPFTPQEMVELKRELEPVVRALAAQKEAARPKGSKPAPGRKGNPDDRSGRVDDSLARYLGKGRRTIDRAEKVIDAAQADPKLQPLVEQMNKTGKVNAAFKRLGVHMQVAEIAANKKNGTLKLPEGKFDRIVADIPWPYELDDESPAERGRAARSYATISISEAKALPIGERCAKDCVIYFWTTNFHMEVAFTILRAWGFTAMPTIITWVKDRFGKGQRLRCATEHCIIGIKGAPVWHLTNQTTRLDGPVREDSRKPDEFYALIDAITPAEASLELFARRALPEGWVGFGDQVGTFKEPTTVAVTMTSSELPIEASAAPEADPWKTATFPGDFMPRLAGDYTELSALEAVVDPEQLSPPPEWIDKLIANKWIIGRKKPRISKLGFEALEQLLWQAATVDIPVAASDDPQIDLEDLLAQTDVVDCRVCADGNFLCVNCLPAAEHVVTMTNTEDRQSVATCRCGWVNAVPWAERPEKQDMMIKEHWRRVVADARAA